jgi:hypothetical protein
MGIGPWITCFWPGLARLWWRGQGSGFAVALFFALWLNATLAAWFAHPLHVPFWGQTVNAAVLGLVWFFSVWRTAGRLSRIYGGDGQYNDALFRRAQEEYVKGRWFEAESLLLRLVADDPADVEGRLLLATLYRHTHRSDLATAQLDQVQRYPRAARWAWEVHQERTCLQRDRAAGALSDSPVLDAAPTSQVALSLPGQVGTAELTPDLGANSGELKSAPVASDAISSGHGGLSKAA